MASSEPAKCELCGMLSSLNPCLPCRAKTRKKDLRNVGLALLGIVVAVPLIMLIGLAGQWTWQRIEPTWRAHSCKGDLQVALRRDRPRLDATVEKCQPVDSGGVLCFVRLLESGEYKTRPFEWNCRTENLPIQ